MKNTTRLSTGLLSAALLASLGVLALGGCSTTPSTTPAEDTLGLSTTSTTERAHVNLASASGSLVSGRLIVTPMAGGVHLRGEIGGLTPGSAHAIHIHEKGDCSAVDATSAGGHFNPTNEPHGKVGTPTHHAGDMDNIVADAKGVADVDVHASGPVLGGGAANDAIGKAVIVHAAQDDYTSQPAGNAGARVACGIITAG
ncbi:MAG TPA: superoxide dismutase family protein [Lysobacter sp.]|nr:superoxide dismutase family protein [Lysobacter sp.]